MPIWEQGKIPFASNQPYLVIVKLKGDVDYGYIKDEQPTMLSSAYFMRSPEIEKLKRYVDDGDNFESMLKNAQKKRKRKHDFALLWHLTWQLSGGNATKWKDILLDLGIVGVYDANSGIIHKNEKQQGVLLTNNSFEITKVFENHLRRQEFEKEKQAQYHNELGYES